MAESRPDTYDEWGAAIEYAARLYENWEAECGAYDGITSFSTALRERGKRAGLARPSIAATCTHGTIGYCEQCALRDPGELGETKPRLVQSHVAAPSECRGKYVQHRGRAGKSWECECGGVSNTDCRARPSHVAATTIAGDAIDLFIEYRDKHGRKETDAKSCAIQEFYDAEAYEPTPPSATLTPTPDPFREAVHALVDKMEACHDDPKYKSVWAINQIHAGPYTGPNYATELAAVKGHMRSLGVAVDG